MAGTGAEWRRVFFVMEVPRENPFIVSHLELLRKLLPVDAQLTAKKHQ